MEVIFAVLCQKALVDKDTNTFSLINVIEEVGLPTDPPEPAGEIESTNDIGKLSPASFEMVIWWSRTQERTPEQGRGRVSVVLPDETRAVSQEVDVDLTRFLRLRSRVHFPGFPDGGQGTYRFQIDYRSGDNDWERKFEYPLRVTLGVPTLPEPEEPDSA